jgi:hypothetical protein
MVMQDSQSRPGKPWGLGVAGVGSAEAIVPDEVGVLVEEGDDVGGEGGCHVFGGGVEPDDDGEVTSARG